MSSKILGAILLLCGLGIFGYIVYDRSPRSDTPMVFSQHSMLTALWDEYKEQYVDVSGRAVDWQREGITTSEGQSYTLLRAVWIDDQATFDLAWRWTRENLQREDGLFAWLFGQRAPGVYGVLSEVGGGNTASDADTDIATALLFAYSRWGEPAYLAEARRIIRGIWQEEVVILNDRPVLAANDLEEDLSAKILVNPSYFSPYAYRMFQNVDPQHAWLDLLDNMYALTKRSTLVKLDAAASAALPPDWFAIDRVTGEVEAARGANLASVYGYEAARLPFRLALDWYWYEDPRAREILESLGFLGEEWTAARTLYATYTHDGEIVGRYETPVMYSGSLGYFLVVQPDLAREVYDQKIKSLYSPDLLSWRTTLSYYDTNWAWFAAALYYRALPNLSPFASSSGPEAYAFR